MQTETETRPAWWDDTAPIPMAPGPVLDDTQIVMRGQSAPVRGRSEYAELAELAVAHGPRDTRAMLAEARRVGQLLADRAFYLFPPLKEPGPTIDLMDALAAVWGRVVARVEILDETNDRVHLRGRVVDLLALTAVERDYMSSLAPPPGRFAKDREQSDRWRVMQLQSASSKAIRGALVHALPAWLVDAAMDAARAEAARIATGGAPLPVARAKAAEHLASKYGLDRTVLEALLGVAADLWTAQELAQLNKLAKQLASGEVAPEAIRAQVAQAAALAPQDAGAGRLAGLGLGLGNPGPAPTSAPVKQSTSTPPSPQPAPPKAQPTTEPAAHQTGAAPASGGTPSNEAAPTDPEQDARALLRILGAQSGEVDLQEVTAAWRDALGLRQLRQVRVADAVRWGSLHDLWEASWDPSGKALSVTLREPERPSRPANDHRSPARRDLEAAVADLERDLGPETVEAARRGVDLGLRAPLDSLSTAQLEAYRDALDSQIPEPGSDGVE